MIGFVARFGGVDRLAFGFFLGRFVAGEAFEVIEQCLKTRGRVTTLGRLVEVGRFAGVGITGVREGDETLEILRDVAGKTERDARVLGGKYSAGNGAEAGVGFARPLRGQVELVARVVAPAGCGLAEVET